MDAWVARVSCQRLNSRLTLTICCCPSAAGRARLGLWVRTYASSLSALLSFPDLTLCHLLSCSCYMMMTCMMHVCWSRMPPLRNNDACMSVGGYTTLTCTACSRRCVICMHTFVWTHGCAHTRMCTYMQAYKHTYKHTHTQLGTTRERGGITHSS